MGFRITPLFPFVLVLAILPTSHVGGQTVVGRLLDGESMQPVSGGFIQLVDSDSFQVSATYGNEEGMFSLTAPAPGEYLIRVEAFSYHPMQDGPVTLVAGDTVGVEFFILLNPTVLDPLVVEAERTDFTLRTSGFYRRQERGMGQFITREAIDDLRPHDMPSLLVWLALGVYLRPNAAGFMVPAFPAGRSSTQSSGLTWCYPMYFLDGLPLVIESDEIGFPIHPNEVAAVEVYATRAETPAHYRDPRASCGTILLWTRR